MLPAAQRLGGETEVPAAKRYSAEKFIELHDYASKTSLTRAVWTIIATPLPGVLSSIIPALIPLSSLRHGPHSSFYGHLFVLQIAVTAGSTVPVIAMAKIPSEVYSLREATVVSLCTALIDVLLMTPIMRFWRFPVPFFWVLCTPVWIVSVILAHLFVLRSKCWKHPELLDAVKKCNDAVSFEVMQIVLYPAMSILFDHVSVGFQILISLSFPIVKQLLKMGIQRCSKDMHDQHAILVIAAVEICASLYQSMIMQSTPSYAAMGIVMGLDVVQGLASVKYFLDRHSNANIPRRKLIPKALRILRTRRQQNQGPAPTTSKLGAIVPLPPSVSSEVVPTPKAAPTNRRLSQKTGLRENDALVHRALQFTQTAETIVLLEYFEVIVPILHCIYLVTAAQFQSAKYNTRIRPFYRDNRQLLGAVGSILMYSALQGVSLVVLHLVMKHRYGVSATYQLAFTLERHQVPIQTKMIAWLPLILNFTTVHYGTDFSFQFDFETWEQW